MYGIESASVYVISTSQLEFVFLCCLFVCYCSNALIVWPLTYIYDLGVKLNMVVCLGQGLGSKVRVKHVCYGFSTISAILTQGQRSKPGSKVNILKDIHVMKYSLILIFRHIKPKPQLWRKKIQIQPIYITTLNFVRSHFHHFSHIILWVTLMSWWIIKIWVFLRLPKQYGRC